MSVNLSWYLLCALTLLLILTVVVSLITRLNTAKDTVVASLRAMLQLGVVSVVIVACMQHIALSLLFCLLMLGVAVFTTARRTETITSIGWVLLSVVAGVVPVLAIILGSGTMPFNGKALIPVAGIIIGNMMTAHTLVGRFAFRQLRQSIGMYEAALAIGLPRSEAIGEIVHPVLREALMPTLDTTRTVGLVTLPGAFVGVLLGGGSPIQAGAVQVLVLVAVLAGQACVVGCAYFLIKSAKELPPDLVEVLQP